MTGAHKAAKFKGWVPVWDGFAEDEVVGDFGRVRLVLLRRSSSELVVWDDVSLVSELSSSEQSWNTCSKSWVMKSELLRRR